MGMSVHRVRLFVIGCALLATALGLLDCVRWIREVVPGFLITAERVIPPIAAPYWAVERRGSEFFEREVVAVDGTAVDSAAEVYERVDARPAGTPIRYTLRGSDGRVTTEVVRSCHFSGMDYVLIFGPFWLGGITCVLVGLSVFLLRPQRADSLALLSAACAAGVWVVTAADLHGWEWVPRLHLLAQSLAAAGLIHVATVFPRSRWRRHRAMLLAGLYLSFGILAVLGVALRPSPSAYHFLYLLLGAADAGAVVTLGAAVASGLRRSQPAVVRRRAAVVTVGTVGGVIVAITVVAVSELLGDPGLVHWCGVALLAFPLSLGCAITTPDLFGLDALLRRTVSGVCVITIVALTYMLTFLISSLVVSAHDVLVDAPTRLALLNLGILVVVAAAQQGIRDMVDRLFFRRRYDVDDTLSTLSQRLAAARAVGGVIENVRCLVMETLDVTLVEIFQRRNDGQFRRAGAPDRDPTAIVLPPALATRLALGQVLSRYEWDDGSGGPIPVTWDQLGAELLIPVCTDSKLVGLLALGAKNSRRAHAIEDVTFLRRVVNQTLLAMNSTSTFEQLEKLNANLEQQVRERTAAVDFANAELNRSNDELNRSNTELSRSLGELRNAYQKLEQSQASLLTADRLATLGRLTAGIAHEMNTPLSAALNSLKILSDLGHEYAAAIDDPEVLPEDHRQIAREIISSVRAATEWTQKSVAFIRRVKAQRRENSTAAERFPIRTVVAETEALLVHRLRVASCRIEFEEDPASVSVMGNPARLAQVLVNLIANAIDAYEENGITGACIQVHAEQKDGTVRLEVRDSAGGIPPHVVPHIFDELFTTKGPGRGTGLGLWIARNIISESFGGTLDVFTTRGVGTCFTATIPAAAHDARTGTAPSTEPAPVLSAETTGTQPALEPVQPECPTSEPSLPEVQEFRVGVVIEEVCANLGERLRASSCRIEYEEESEGVSLIGEAAQFRRILVSLVMNAIAAYEVAGITDGRIALGVRRVEKSVTVTVRNWAGGLPMHLLPHIFDHTVTSEAPSAGVAQGLWIARNIIEHSFGGFLDVMTATGGGTCFLAIFPAAAVSADAGPDPGAVPLPVAAG
jgi:C4-dicarboxylate-specific signal transduction histidine kinase